MLAIITSHSPSTQYPHRASWFVALVALMALLSASCGSEPNESSAAQADSPTVVDSTAAPEPTPSPVATATAIPTATAEPAPTATPAPTSTPKPTPTVATAAAPEPTATPVEESGTNEEAITDNDLILNQFNAHFEAAMTGDWAVYLEGCSPASRAGKTTEIIAAKWATSMDRLGLSDQGMQVTNIEVQMLDGISALVWANLSELGDVRHIKPEKEAWVWSKEGDNWYDIVCSLGGS